MIGTLASVPLPDAARPPAPWDPLQRALYERHRIEVPVFTFPAAPRRLVRFAAQAYNSLDQVELLARALPELLA